MRDTGLRTTENPPRQPTGDGHTHQDREQTDETCELEEHTGEVRIKSEPSLEPCEDFWDVLDELGEILDEEQAVFELKQKSTITPVPPPICLADDTSLFTRRSNRDSDPSPISFDESSEISCTSVANNLSECEIIEDGASLINTSYEPRSHCKLKTSPSNDDHKTQPRARRSSSKEPPAALTNRAIESNSRSPRPKSQERTLAHRKSKPHSSTSAGHKQRPENSRRRNSRSPSKRRKSPVRSKGLRRSVSQNSRHYKADQNRRHRSRSSERIRAETRRRSSPRDRLDRRQRSTYRSRSPDNMRRSTYIWYPSASHRPWAERIQRHRKSSSLSPRRTHLSRYSPVRLPRQRSRSRSSPEKFARRRRSRSRSFRSKYPARNVCNNRSHQARSLIRYRSRSLIRYRSRSRIRDRSRSLIRDRSRSLIRDRSRSLIRDRSRSLIRDRSRSIARSTKILQRQRSGSRSMSPSVPLRVRSSSISRPLQFLNGSAPGSPQYTTRRRRSPSAQSQPLMNETTTAVPVAASYQADPAGEQMMTPLRRASPVINPPRPIAPMITLHDNRVSRPNALRNHLLPTPPPYMFCMQTHFTNIIDYRSMGSYQASGPPFNPAPANLAPFDLRHRLATSRSFSYLGPNDLRHRIQELYGQNNYPPPPAFNAHVPWPPGYTIDYNSNGYY